MKTKRVLSFLLVVVIAAGLLTGCTGGASESGSTSSASAEASSSEASITAEVSGETPVTGETELVVALPGDLETTDPTYESSGNARSLYGNVYESLVQFSNDGTIVMRLASSFEQTGENDWEVYLREDALFSDGSPVTADDIVTTFERCALEGSRLKTYVSTIADVEIIADDHFIIHTTSPDLILPNRMANVFIVSAASCEDFDNGTIVAPLGSGPYKVESRTVNEETVLTLNEYCNYQPGIITRLVYRVIPEAATRIAELQAGTVDIISGLTPDLIPVLDASDNVTVYADGARSRILYYTFNLNGGTSPVNDVRVRQAINYAVDVDTIIETIYLGAARPLSQPCDQTSNGYNSSLEPYGYDVEKAKELLAEAGYDESNPCEITLTTTNDHYFCDSSVSQAVAAYLEEAGIVVDLQVMEYATYWNALVNLELEGMFIATNGNYFNDADNVVGLWFNEGARGGYTSEEAQELIALVRSTTSAEERSEALQQLMQLYHDEAAWLFMVDYNDIYATNSHLRGWAPASLGMLYLNEAYFVE